MSNEKDRLKEAANDIRKYLDAKNDEENLLVQFVRVIPAHLSKFFFVFCANFNTIYLVFAPALT